MWLGDAALLYKQGAVGRYSPWNFHYCSQKKESPHTHNQSTAQASLLCQKNKNLFLTSVWSFWNSKGPLSNPDLSCAVKLPWNSYSRKMNLNLKLTKPSPVFKGTSRRRKKSIPFLNTRKMRHTLYIIISNLEILVQPLFFSWKENVKSLSKISEHRIQAKRMCKYLWRIRAGG